MFVPDLIRNPNCWFSYVQASLLTLIFHPKFPVFQRFVSSVDSLLSDLGVREDIYHLGHTSRLLATELDTFPTARNRRKVDTCTWFELVEDYITKICPCNI